jgi:hypothetical protein
LQTTSLSYKLIKKIKDERFDEDLIHQYHLFIHIGARDLQIGVMDPQESRFLLLEDYVFPSLGSHDELIQLLDQLFDAHAFLKAAFWKAIKISIKNNKFVQVPEVLYVEGAQAEYLKFNAAIDVEEEAVLSVMNAGAKAVTVFAMQRELRQWLLQLYPNNTPVFMHQSAVLIEGVIKFARHQKESPLYIYVDRFKLHILFCKQGNLLYYNQFTIKQFSDYIRYIMLVMKSLNLNQRTSQIILWGYIGKNSQHYNEFYKYINNVIFGDRPKDLHFGYMFDEVQDHHFFDLYSMKHLGN